MPNYELERARLALQVGEMELALRRIEFRYAELEDERQRIAVNEKATHKALDELKSKLMGLKES